MTWSLILAVLTVVTVVARIVIVNGQKDAPGNENVAVAFAPPRAITPGLAAVLRRDTKDSDTVPAEILDLAVKGVWKVGVDGDENDKVWFVQRDDVRPPADLSPMARQTYEAIFPDGSLEERVELRPDQGRTMRFRQIVAEAWDEIQRRGWIEAGTSMAVQASGWAGLALALVGFLSLINGALVGGFAAVGGGIITRAIRPKGWRYTSEGRRINDELDGLKLYMTMAEDDRMKVLQSPETAERLPALHGGESRGEVAKLHERLLPYAVLFGILPQWSEVLKQDYVEAQEFPTWFFVADMATDLMMWDILTGGGLDMFGMLGDFDMDALGAGLGDLNILGDGGGLFGGEGGGLFDGGGDGGGLFDGFDLDF